EVQSLHADAEALARFADDGAGGDSDIVIFEAREWVRRDDLDPLLDADPARVGGDDEGGKAARAFAFAGAREGQVEIRDAAIRNVGLFPDQHPFIAVAQRRGLDVRRVVPAFRLGHGEGGDGFTRRDAGQPLALLLDRAEEADRTRAE